MGRKISPRQSQHVVGERCDSISDFETLSSYEKVALMLLWIEMKPLRLGSQRVNISEEWTTS